MKKKIILRSIIILVIGFIIYESHSIMIMLKNSHKIEEVKPINTLKNSDKSIAIMVQDNETEEWHEAENRDSWPSPTTHGYVGAECTDSDGAEIDYTNILKFDLTTYHATIDTKNSIYCTLYFAKGRPVTQALEETKGTSLDLNTVVDGMYRYKGTTSVANNNYICFGTTDKEECLGNPKTYMYRIIGITSAADTAIGLKKDQLKIIKATPSSELVSWGSDTKDQPWDSSYAKSTLNGDFLNSIKNAQPNGAYWDSIITSQKWYNADQKSISTIESKASKTLESKIALMYATDYKNSGDQNTNNWLFITNGWTGNALGFDWTMTRYGESSGRYLGWRIYKNGTVNYSLLADHDYEIPYVFRPVFYLQPELNLTGKGIATDPFRITTKNNA